MDHSDIANPEEEARKCMVVLGAAPFSLFVFIAKCIFLWPGQNPRTKFIGRFFINLYLSTLIISSAMKVFEECKKENINSNSIIECTLQILLFTLILYIYIFILFDQSKVTMCMSIIFKLFESSDSSGQQIFNKIIKKAFQFGDIEAVGVLLLGASYVILPVATPIILSGLTPNNLTYEKVLPLKTQLFLDENKYFYCIYVVQFLMAILLALVSGVMNYYQYMCSGVIIAQFQCLEYYSNEIDNEFNYNIPELDETKTNLICERLKAIIRRHQNCIKLFETFHSMTRPLALGSIVLNTCVLILTGTWMVISLANSNLTEAAKMFLAFTSILMVIIQMCIPSQLMSNASYDFFLQSYCINWYNYPVKDRLMLIMIMAKSIKPLVLAAGPTIELNFDTCSSIIKGTISYIATFRSLYASL